MNSRIAKRFVKLPEGLPLARNLQSNVPSIQTLLSAKESNLVSCVQLAGLSQDPAETSRPEMRFTAGRDMNPAPETLFDG